ncbi:hypothetical protein ABPG72_003137 [Tetrahymena utriculariae]
MSIQQSMVMISKVDYPLIPEEAFLYFPQPQEIKVGEGKTGLRRIFEGQIQFDKYEMQQLQDFEQYVKQKQTKLIGWWDNAKKLRFLYANQFKYEKTLKTMETHQEWRSQALPPKFTEDIKQFLETGAFYVHGRDNRFRPILVINVKRLNFKNIKIELILDSMTYFFEFIINNMMLPGQIENWVVILDLGNIGLSSLPISGLKQIMGYLSSNYRSRMFATYVVNTPSSIFIPYKIIKGFLEEATIKKISFYSNGNPKPLFTHCHKSQIESTYNGDSKAINEKFWPPKVISNQYQLIEENPHSIFQSRDEYNKQYKSGLLKKNITLKEYILEGSEENNQVNPESINLISFTKKKNDIFSTRDLQDVQTPSRDYEHKKKFDIQRSLNIVNDMQNSGNQSQNNIQNMLKSVQYKPPKSSLAQFCKEDFQKNLIEEFEEDYDEKQSNQKKMGRVSQDKSRLTSNMADNISVAHETYIEKNDNEPSINLVIVKQHKMNSEIFRQ